MYDVPLSSIKINIVSSFVEYSIYSLRHDTTCYNMYVEICRKKIIICTWNKIVPSLTVLILSISTEECRIKQSHSKNIDDIRLTVKYESHVINIQNTKNNIYFLNQIDGPSVFTGNITILHIENVFIEYAVINDPAAQIIRNSNIEFWNPLLWYKYIIINTEISEIISQIPMQ